ncbi:ATP synthase subunit O, mitochondrial [Galemys pyrenaicus]|uniref:ATP synthase peripheral stalk subunit OSCP, mitochondrial n=1 Tax=Galemys pyrenaicus TaxID=202257 RepID=A0A8J6AHQ7_GALPY|nr:ATP synthase subunit O, mitochondrial [Galemys pyrenaicus]
MTRACALAYLSLSPKSGLTYSRPGEDGCPSSIRAFPAGRYATALYSAASKQNKLEQVEKELVRVAQLLKEPKMATSILNPHVKRSIKVKSLNDMTAKERFSPLTVNLINLLAENGRLNNTPAIISAFTTMMSVHRGEVPCTVTTASTDPSIMGGMIVRIGEKYVDMSAKTKIQKLSKVMRETV